MQDITTEQLKKLEKIAEFLDNGGTPKDVMMSDLMAQNIGDSIKEACSNITVKAQVDIPPFPTIPEQKAPIVNVQAPQSPEVTVNVDTKGVQKEITDLHTTTKEIKDILSIKEEFEPVQIYDKNGKLVDWARLLQRESNGNMDWLQIVNAINNPTSYAIQIDDVSTSGVTYIGKAGIGSTTSSAVWQVQKLDESGSPITTVIKWADSGQFTQIWNNRTSLTYN